MLRWDLEPGDVICFDSYTVHGSPGNSSNSVRRRAYAMRWCSEGVTFDSRPGTMHHTWVRSHGRSEPVVHARRVVRRRVVLPTAARLSLPSLQRSPSAKAVRCARRALCCTCQPSANNNHHFPPPLPAAPRPVPSVHTPYQIPRCVVVVTGGQGLRQQAAARCRDGVRHPPSDTHCGVSAAVCDSRGASGASCCRSDGEGLVRTMSEEALILDR